MNSELYSSASRKFYYLKYHPVIVGKDKSISRKILHQSGTEIGDSQAGVRMTHRLRAEYTCLNPIILSCTSEPPKTLEISWPKLQQTTKRNAFLAASKNADKAVLLIICSGYCEFCPTVEDQLKVKCAANPDIKCFKANIGDINKNYDTSFDVLDYTYIPYVAFFKHGHKESEEDNVGFNIKPMWESSDSDSSLLNSDSDPMWKPSYSDSNLLSSDNDKDNTQNYMRDCSSPITIDQLDIANEVEKVLFGTSPEAKMIKCLKKDEIETKLVSEKLGNASPGGKKKPKIDIEIDKESETLEKKKAIQGGKRNAIIDLEIEKESETLEKKKYTGGKKKPKIDIEIDKESETLEKKKATIQGGKKKSRIDLEDQEKKEDDYPISRPPEGDYSCQNKVTQNDEMRGGKKKSGIVLEDENRKLKEEIAELKKSLQSDQPDSTYGDDAGILSNKEEDEKNRKYKKYFCPFCHELKTHYSRHLLNNHQDEDEVIKLASIKPNSKERKHLLSVIRGRGSLIFNTDYNLNKGELIVARRCKNVTEKSMKPCIRCHNYYTKTTLWRHHKLCTGEKNAPKDLQTLSNAIVVGEETDKTLNPMFRNLILPGMERDEVYRYLVTDATILEFGNYLCVRNREQHLKNMIRTKLRQVGKVVIQMKNIDCTINNLDEALSPAHYDIFVEAANLVAGYNGHHYSAPSLIGEIGRSMKVIANRRIVHYIKTGNKTRKKEVESWLKLYENEFYNTVGRNALRTIQRKRWGKTQLVPLTEDIIKLNSYIVQEISRAQNILARSFDQEAFNTLNKSTIAQIQMFNRKRAGEIEKFEITDFEKRHNIQKGSIFYKNLSESEKIVSSKYVRVETRGKLHLKPAAMLLTLEQVKTIQLILHHRKNANIPETCPFVFGRKTGTFSAYISLKEAAYASDAKQPELLLGTLLRKQIATTAQALNFSENDMTNLAAFLGHDIKTHRQFYRLPNEAIQLAKISRLLMAMDNGTIDKFHGKKLDEINVNVEVGEDNDGSDIEEPNSNEKIPLENHIETRQDRDIIEKEQTNRKVAKNNRKDDYGGRKEKGEDNDGSDIEEPNSNEKIPLENHIETRQDRDIIEKEQTNRKVAKNNRKDDYGGRKEKGEDNDGSDIEEPNSNEKIPLENHIETRQDRDIIEKEQTNRKVAKNNRKDDYGGRKEKGEDNDGSDIEEPNSNEKIPLENHIETRQDRDIIEKEQTNRKVAKNNRKDDENKTMVDNSITDMTEMIQEEENDNSNNTRKPAVLRKTKRSSLKTPPRKIPMRHSWTTPERHTVRRLFQDTISHSNLPLPTPLQCREAIKNHKELRGLSINQIKGWVCSERKRKQSREHYQ